MIFGALALFLAPMPLVSPPLIDAIDVPIVMTIPEIEEQAAAASPLSAEGDIIVSAPRGGPVDPLRAVNEKSFEVTSRSTACSASVACSTSRSANLSG